LEGRPDLLRDNNWPEQAEGRKCLKMMRDYWTRLLVLITALPFLCLSASALAQTRQVTLPKEVVRQLANDSEVWRVEKIDLNNDGRRELIVQTGCSVVGNCSTSIFRKTKNRYELLLNDEAQVVTTGGKGAYGYLDVVFKVHDSAYRSTISTYKFDGQQYHLEGCLYREYSFIDRNGNLRIRKLPRISKC
jgi:hypothetical protein